MGQEQPPNKKQRMLLVTDEAEATLQLEELGELPPLPFVDKYSIDKYYIRERYDKYYKLVKDMLDKKRKCVTVTGTPGIGKSIFYAYFFQRFQKEMKVNDTWIVAAANIRNELLNASAFKDNDGEVVKLRTEDAIDDFLEEADQKKKQVLVLCDGPPKEEGLGSNGGVYKSKHRMAKNGEETQLHSVRASLTLAELQEAAAKLDRKKSDGSPVTAKDIVERFYTLGGVARECFSCEKDFVEMKRSDLTLEIAEIPSPRELETFIIKGKTLAGFHLIVHFVPKLNGERVESQLASQLVVEKLAERMLEAGKINKESLRRSLEDVHGGTAVAKWIFKLTCMKPSHKAAHWSCVG